MSNNVQVNSHGTNMAIKPHILSDNEMRAIGFTDHNPLKWYYCRIIPGIDKNTHISFNVTIPKDGSGIEIITLDEDFLQIYDYWRILENYPNHKVANIVNEHVEQWMQYLTDKGVIKGWHKGMYI